VAIRIKVEPDFLRQEADKIRSAGRALSASGETLLDRIQELHSGHAQLIVDAKRDSQTVQNDSLLGLNRRGSRFLELADRLVELADRFETADQAAVAGILSALGNLTESAILIPNLKESVLGLNPKIFLDDIPDIRMVTWGQVPIYIGDPSKKKYFGTLKEGQFTPPIIGTFTASDGATYYVVIVGSDESGHPILGYIPVSINLSDSVNLIDVPLRAGEFKDGDEGEFPDLPSPWGPGCWPDSWSANQWWVGGPLQDLFLRKMGIAGIARTGANQNLCGEMCKMEAVGATDIPGELTTFSLIRLPTVKNPNRTGLSILNQDESTSPVDLIAFFHANGYSAKQGSGSMPTPSELAQGLAGGGKYVFLTDLNTVTGNLSTGGHAGHWVDLKDVFRDESGNYFVEVYNPYTGKTQIYTWDTFVASCKSPGTYLDRNTGKKVNQTGPIYLEATKDESDTETDTP
jgi:hypothetical protein